MTNHDHHQHGNSLAEGRQKTGTLKCRFRGWQIYYVDKTAPPPPPTCVPPVLPPLAPVYEGAKTKGSNTRRSTHARAQPAEATNHKDEA